MGWENAVQEYRLAGGNRSFGAGLKDEGTDIGRGFEIPVCSPQVLEAKQAFVKFFGRVGDRVSTSRNVVDELKHSGYHWACTYPKGRRPTGVNTGAVLFLARLVRDPDDIVIYGRAIGVRHEPVRDDATPNDIQLRQWKMKWPHYIRVHNVEVVAGTLSNGISLNELMTALHQDSFAPTQRNAAAGTGNINPRRAYLRQAAVELTQQGASWLSGRLEAAFLFHGRLAPSELDKLDWPQR